MPWFGPTPCFSSCRFFGLSAQCEAMATSAALCEWLWLPCMLHPHVLLRVRHNGIVPCCPSQPALDSACSIGMSAGAAAVFEAWTTLSTTEFSTSTAQGWRQQGRNAMFFNSRSATRPMQLRGLQAVLANSGRFRQNFVAESRSNLAEMAPNSCKCAHMCHRFGQSRPRGRPDLGPSFPQTRPNVGGWNRPTSAQHRPNLARNQPTLARSRPTLAESCQMRPT